MNDAESAVGRIPTSRSRPAHTVSAFYDALGRDNADALRAIIESSFTPDVELLLPASLPYGGTVRGLARVRRVFLAAVGATAGPRNLVLTSLLDTADGTPTEGGQMVAAVLRFDWVPPDGSSGIPSGAVEVWSFDHNDAVASIRAYYEDTAALVAATPAATT